MQEVFKKIIMQLGIRAEKSEKKEMDAEHFEYAQMYKGERIAFGDAIEIVKQEAEKFGTDTNVGSNGWIPVSDHIPVPAKKLFGNKQKRTNVLVTLRNGLVKEMTFEFETNEFWEVGDDNHIEHWKEDAIDTDVEVIAWQPLPLPFRDKE